MKYKQCPKCGSTDLGDRWCRDRKLQQYCHHQDEGCYWKAEPRTPERKRITNTDELLIDGFCGWHYIVYDRYGHIRTDSATYDTRAEAMVELREDIIVKEGYNDPAAPYTAVLFNIPSSITIKGKMYRVKNGEVKSV